MTFKAKKVILALNDIGCSDVELSINHSKWNTLQLSILVSSFQNPNTVTCKKIRLGQETCFNWELHWSIFMAKLSITISDLSGSFYWDLMWHFSRQTYLPSTNNWIQLPGHWLSTSEKTICKMFFWIQQKSRPFLSCHPVVGCEIKCQNKSIILTP